MKKGALIYLKKFSKKGALKNLHKKEAPTCLPSRAPWLAAPCSAALKPIRAASVGRPGVRGGRGGESSGGSLGEIH